MMDKLSPGCVAELVALVGTFVAGVLTGFIAKITKRR
jgi:hypothetical protein